jgi:gamma-glutamyltranspeptidase/glutathione hydrolase
VLISACDGTKPPLGVVGHVEGDFGGAVSDEPMASLVARDILKSGGTAADAVAAMYFTMSVTYPSAAGLGGGGVCVVHGPGSDKVEVLDFRSRRPARRPPAGQPEFAVPGNVRGMAALHARYGRLRWSQLVQPAERLARFGHSVSRAFASEIKRSALAVEGSPDLKALLAGTDGSLLVEGEDLRQINLSVVLGRVRARGAGEFYTGDLASRLAAAYEAAGGTVTIEDLRGYLPVWREPAKGKIANNEVHFPPSPVTGGALAQKLWDILSERGTYRKAAKDARDIAILDAAIEAYKSDPAFQAAGGDGAEIPDFGVTSFAAMDHLGGAAACSVTMNAPFGLARLAPGTGVIVGAAPTPDRDGAVALVPMLVFNAPNKNPYFAAGVSGGASSPTSLISIALKVMADQRKLADASDAARYHAGRSGRTAFVEARAGDAAEARVKTAGYRVVRVEGLGRFNGIWCREGIVRDPATCDYVSDTRGFGYGVSVER